MAQRLPILFNRKPCYDIVYSAGFEELKDELVELFQDDCKFCIVTDSNVDPLYSEEVMKVVKDSGHDCYRFVFFAGEENKNLDSIKGLYVYLIENHFNRKDKLIALGGGVVGDMTGYAAATYLRGISFIQVPTTLLSQADSSIGGKTGVDFDGYKNMIGAFKMPELVYMNLASLKTLDERQYFSGFAEIMKSALIKDEEYYSWLIDNMYEICQRDVAVVTEMVMRSNVIKKTVVEKDPFEKGDRALLNLGHTIGHAIEKAKNFELLHGECVALGCVAAAFISWKKGMIKMDDYYEIRDMFVPFYLPITVDGIEPEDIVQLTKSDKKAEKDHVRFILLKRIGKAVVDNTVTEEEIIEAVKELIFDEAE